VATETGKATMQRTLGLTGVTVNAMALIAPGAFLWITYQIQAAQTVPGGGDSTDMDMWPGIVFALILAFLTAISYSELARIYPEAGTGSCYYFAEKAFLDKEETAHHKWGRLAKLVTGWAAHLFYWVYPGVMVSFMAILISYIVGQLTGVTLGVVPQLIIAGLFSLVVSFIAFRGVSGSTMTSLVINVVQLTALVLFSIMAIAYRLINPEQAEFVFPSAGAVVLPHNLLALLMQATVAILILVGFESCTAFGAEARNPRRDVPRAVLLALVIQGLLAYLFEYFSANFAISDKLTGTTADGAAVTGMDAAAASTAPIGDMIQQIGGAFFGPGVGFALMIVVAITVALAILGTTLSAMNTGVRITYAMAQDKEMPDLLGLLHGRYATPHTAVVVLGVVSALIGALGTLSVVWLTGITLASNFGTFVLYGLTCLWAIIGFASRPDFNFFKHGVVPGLGMLANVAMLVTILGVGVVGGGDSQTESFIAIGFAAAWAVLSALYVVLQNRRSGRALIAPPSPLVRADASPR
jgi:amino acid transporter